MTGKCFILGTFSNINARTFPATHKELHVYIAMTNGHGSSQAKLQFVNLATNEPILELHGDIAFPNLLAVVEMDFHIENLNFKEPGQYEFRFICNDEPIGQRKIAVNRARNVPEEKAR